VVTNFLDQDDVDFPDDDVEEHNAVGNGACEGKSNTLCREIFVAEGVSIEEAAATLLLTVALVDACSLCSFGVVLVYFCVILE